MKSSRWQLFFTVLALLAGAVSPNLFVVAQAGYAKLSHLAVVFLIPSIILLGIVILAVKTSGYRNLGRQIYIGLLAGILATLGLEIVREIGFRLGGMPGEMPQLMGVLMLDRFAIGPNWLSNLVGWAYHFWNGASFGLIYSLLLGRPPSWSGPVFGILIGVGLMVSPVVVAMGVGIFGSQFGIGFPITVILAHIAFGLVLGNFVVRKNKDAVSLWGRLKTAML